MFRLILLLPVDFVGDGQPHLAADLLGSPCRAVAHKGRVVHLAVDADAVCDQVDMQIIRIFMRADQSLMFAQIHFIGESPHDSEQIARSEFLFVLRGDADFETQVFVPAAFVVPVCHFKLAQNPVGVQTAQQIRRKDLSELAFSQGVSDGITAVGDGSSFGYHSRRR